jgi:tetratricopeptide (TPR) repeat protein
MADELPSQLDAGTADHATPEHRGARGGHHVMMRDRRRLRIWLAALVLALATGLVEFVTDPDLLPWPIWAWPFLLIAGSRLAGYLEFRSEMRKSEYPRGSAQQLMEVADADFERAYAYRAKRPTRPKPALAFAERALAAARHVSSRADTHRLAMRWGLTADLRAMAGDPSGAKAACAACWTLYQELDREQPGVHDLERAQLLTLWGKQYELTGDSDEAGEKLSRAIELFRGRPERTSEGAFVDALLVSARLAAQEHENARAQRLINEAVATARDIDKQVASADIGLRYVTRTRLVQALRTQREVMLELGRRVDAQAVEQEAKRLHHVRRKQRPH